MNYNKNSVKLLSIVEKFENKVVLHTEFDGNYDIGDKLYIMVIDSGSTDYILDSFQYSGNTYRSIGYELLNKEGNKLTLDIDYELTLGTGTTTLIYGNCYIGRVYIRQGTISSGVVNGSLLYDVSILPKNNLSLIWYQAILAKSPHNITNINFNTYTGDSLVLKSEVTANNTINSYYTINNYNNGLSIINLFGDIMLLYNCGVNAGVFNYCNLDGKFNVIANGILNNSYIGKSYIINGGEFVNCTLDSTVTWNNGTWSNDWDGILGSNPFTPSTWKNGTWKNGVFPYPRSWYGGRFMKGIFKGKRWYDGNFGTKDSISDDVNADTVFSGSSWNNGSFNGGLMVGSAWENGTWYNGVIKNSLWHNGTFNSGTFSGSTWEDGTFNNGEIHYSDWNNGTFNNGTIYDSNWYNGIFNDGGLKQSVWYDGHFYGGKLENTLWHTGSFYKGSIFGSDWLSGDLYYGLMNNINWSGGTWHNGIANNVIFSGGTWLNGIFNYGYFYNGIWLNGSFNSGYFSGSTATYDAVWKGGNFYFGEFNGLWSGGTFYTGKIQTYIPDEDIINREFYQYNKSGLISNKYSTVKLPAKKKY